MNLDPAFKDLIDHLDRIATRRFLATPEPITGFSDFPEVERSPVCICHGTGCDFCTLDEDLTK